MKAFRDHFPLLSDRAYLNTAAWGLLHDDVLEWRREHDQKFFEGGSEFKFSALEILGRTRERVGQCFGCAPGRVALVPNFSIGWNLLLEGLPAPKSVALLDGEYPSVSWPFEARGFEIHTVSRLGDTKSNLQRLIAEKRPGVLALSMVQWIDGLFLSAEFLSDLKRQYPDMLILADATQYLGAGLLDFDRSGIDLVGASGYKWMLAGNGNGFMLLRDGLESVVHPGAVGFNSVEGDLSRKDEITLAQALEPGHLDTLNFGSLHRALGLLEETGLEKITAYNKRLGGMVRHALAERGLLQGEAALPGTLTTIFNIPDIRDRFERLSSRGVICSRRGGGIRLSFHCYNNENDLDRVLEALKNP